MHIRKLYMMVYILYDHNSKLTLMFIEIGMNSKTNIDVLGMV